MIVEQESKIMNYEIHELFQDLLQYDSEQPEQSPEPDETDGVGYGTYLRRSSE